MRTVIYDALNRGLTFSVVNSATGQVWSPSKPGWVDDAPDALQTPVWSKSANHKGIGAVTFAGLAQPANVGDYVLVGHDPANGNPTGTPAPMAPLAQPGQVINYIALNVGA